MKYRITEYENGEGSKWWTVQVRSGLWVWKFVSRAGSEYHYSPEEFESREDAIASIDRNLQWKIRKKVRVVNVEYITK